VCNRELGGGALLVGGEHMMECSSQFGQPGAGAYPECSARKERER
jgi:hypothetical protein